MRLAVAIIAVAWASQYSPGVMEEVVANRQAGRAWVPLPKTLPQVDGYVAVRDCERLEEIVPLRPVGAERWERFLVVDCARPTDPLPAWFTDTTVEVDYVTAQRWDIDGRKAQVEIGRLYNANIPTDYQCHEPETLDYRHSRTFAYEHSGPGPALHPQRLLVADTAMGVENRNGCLWDCTDRQPRYPSMDGTVLTAQHQVEVGKEYRRGLMP